MAQPSSPSIEFTDYWWYTARADLLEAALSRYVGEPQRVLDVGSADGPSVQWLRKTGTRVALDMDPSGLEPGDVCGNALALPFADGAFDLVAAFDVIEHCEPESRALAEIHRVLAPGGTFLMSVPAYEWAWTSHDDLNHHHRRYTRKRAARAVEAAGFELIRTTYVFTGTFPLFAADRVRSRIRERGTHRRGPQHSGPIPLPEVSPRIERLLLRLSRWDERRLAHRDLPFGSSVVIAARKHG